MSSRRTRVGRLAVAAAAMTWALAGAQTASAEILIVESWVGGPSPQEREWASTVRASLTSVGGFVASPTAIAQALGPRRPLPPLSAPKDPADSSLLARFSAARASFNDGIAQYRRGRFQAGEKLLAALVTEAQLSPLIFATEVGRPVYRQAMLYLALCRSRLRLPQAAAQVAEEFVRTFPSKSEDVFTDFGPIADRLYRAAEAKLTAMGRGTLLVEVSERDAVVSVNESLGANRAFEGSVLPGVYRVLVKTSASGARRYEVPVRANESVRLTIDWQLDRALLLTQESASLVFDSDRDRGSEGSVAVSLAQAISAGPRVVVLGSRIYNGYRAVSASLYDVKSGRHLGTALAVMDGRMTDAKLLAIKTYVVSGGETVNDHLIASALPLDTVAMIEAETPLTVKESPARWPAYVAASGSALAFGAGVVLLERDRRGSCDGSAGASCTSAGFAPYAYGLFGASVGLAGFAVYYWMRPRPGAAPARTRAAPQSFGAVPTGGGATAWLGWSF
ncbi:MAG: hypothetical protein IPI49_29410 [Myxococcales bacterium]|nr:hypothetical protein [Myxococcales bacterium]